MKQVYIIKNVHNIQYSIYVLGEENMFKVRIQSLFTSFSYEGVSSVDPTIFDFRFHIFKDSPSEENARRTSPTYD